MIVFIITEGIDKTNVNDTIKPVFVNTLAIQYMLVILCDII